MSIAYHHDFFTQVNRCHVFACPTWPQAKATIWQLNDFVRWKHKICALSSWKGVLIVVFSADAFEDELSLVMFFLDVGSRFVSWSGSACRCFANWACLETVVTARRNRGERRSHWLTFHLTLQVNSFRWCSYMHVENHGRRFRCGTSYNFNLPWQAYVMCKISYVVNYIYDKHQDSFKTDIFAILIFADHCEHIPLCFIWSFTQRAMNSFGFSVCRTKQVNLRHPCRFAGKKRGTAREVKKKPSESKSSNSKLHHALMNRRLLRCYLKLLKGS